MSLHGDRARAEVFSQSSISPPHIFPRTKTHNPKTEKHLQPLSSAFGHYTMNPASNNNNTCPIHAPSQRRGSADSFGMVYDEKENALFLQLARSAFEEDDDEDSIGTATPFSVHCGEDESEPTTDFDEEGDDCVFHFLMRSKNMVRSSTDNKKRTNAVTFGHVSVCEFKTKDAPMLVRPKTTRENELKMSVSVFEYTKVLRPSSSFAMRMKQRRRRPKMSEHKKSIR